MDVIQTVMEAPILSIYSRAAMTVQIALVLKIFPATFLYTE
jgi:hypothetical protein